MFSFMRSPATTTSSPEDDKLLYSDNRSASQDTDERNLGFPSSVRERQRGCSVWPWILHLGLICVYTTVTILILDSRKNSCAASGCGTMVYTPAHDAIKYERATLDAPLGAHSPYVGQPGPQVDEAWNSILKYMNTRLPQEEMDRLNRTSVPLSDDKGGYFVALDVFHELHCLNTIRQQVYRNDYPTKEPMKEQLKHADHCIDILRQVLMCHGDLSVVTYEWIEDYRWPWPQFKAEHECRNWDAITDWAEGYSIESIHGPILTHPTLGVSWRDEELA